MGAVFIAPLTAVLVYKVLGLPVGALVMRVEPLDVEQVQFASISETGQPFLEALRVLAIVEESAEKVGREAAGVIVKRGFNSFISGGQDHGT
jgi:hypothetical protein